MALNSTLKPVRRDPVRGQIAALFGAVACFGVVAITEPPGPGLDPDSMSYVGAAESLVHHGSLRIPMSSWSDADSTSALRHFPPGFSLAISVPVALGADPGQAARGVEAVAAFATVALAVWIAAAIAGPAAGTLTGVALLAAPALALDHARILSEPLCFALLVAMLALMLFSDRPFLYGLAAAAAGLVRYAAVPAGGAAVLWAIGRPGDLRERLRRAALAAIPTALLSGPVMLRSVLESGAAHGIKPRLDLGPMARELGATLEAWLAPAMPAGVGAALVAVVVAGAGIALLRDAASGRAGRPQPGSPARSLMAAAALVAACYAAFVFVSRVFVFDNIPFDDRMLSPVMLLVLITMAATFGACWRAWTGRVRGAAAALAGLWLVASAWGTVRAVGDARDGGWGYASDEWRDSRLGPWLRAEGRSTEIFSNDPAAVWFLVHRPSRDLPEALDSAALDDFARTIAGRRAVVLSFGQDYEPMASPDSLARRLGLKRLASFREGTVWGNLPRQ